MLCVLWPNSWMDQDTTWYGDRPWPRWHCVRWGPSSLPHGKGHSNRPLFWPMSVVAKRSPISATSELLSPFGVSALRLLVGLWEGHLALLLKYYQRYCRRRMWKVPLNPNQRVEDTWQQTRRLAVCCRDDAAACRQHSDDADWLWSNGDETGSHWQVGCASQHAERHQLRTTAAPACTVWQPPCVGRYWRRTLTVAKCRFTSSHSMKECESRISGGIIGLGWSSLKLNREYEILWNWKCDYKGNANLKENVRLERKTSRKTCELKSRKLKCDEIRQQK